MSRQVVVWSGGADSTYLLHWYATCSSIQNPVHAITVDSHSQLNKKFMAAQRAARGRYLKFAEKLGLPIEVHTVIQDCSEKISIGIGKNTSAQPMMWLCSIMPFVKDDDVVCFSYISEDGIWHHKRDFEDVFDSICRLKNIDAKLHFSLENFRKYQVLQKLTEYGIKDNMWWSCENPQNKKPCGICYKCCELKLADIKFEMDKKNPQSPFYEGEKK